MRITQYSYFQIGSEVMAGAEMSDRLGTLPDEHSERGRRSSDPIVPRSHSWKVVCKEPGLRVDDQIRSVVGRREPIVDRNADLVGELHELESGRATTLQVVRFFDDDEGEEDRPNPHAAERGMRKLDGQHFLLGWHLDRNVLQFVERTGAESTSTADRRGGPDGLRQPRRSGARTPGAMRMMGSSGSRCAGRRRSACPAARHGWYENHSPLPRVTRVASHCSPERLRARASIRATDPKGQANPQEIPSPGVMRVAQ